MKRCGPKCITFANVVMLAMLGFLLPIVIVAWLLGKISTAIF